MLRRCDLCTFGDRPRADAPILCRHEPPLIVKLDGGGLRTGWPEVKANDWCGGFLPPEHTLKPMRRCSCGIKARQACDRPGCQLGDGA